jgi:hypothetical protein
MAISDDERFKLRYGPYKTPRFKYGKKVQDEWRGDVSHHRESREWRHGCPKPANVHG